MARTELLTSRNVLIGLTFIFPWILRVDNKFSIERRVTLKKTLPYPSADSFENIRLFGIRCFSSGCERKGAKCLSRRLFSSCCTCECRGHVPNFFSLRDGCVSEYTLQRTRGASCRYILQGSSSSFVPTFTSYKDFQSGSLILQPRYSSMAEIVRKGTCEATAIYYFDKNGQKRKLFENHCSEVIGIRQILDDEGETLHRLTWTWIGNSGSVWNKLRGRLLSISIVCKARVQATSCLLFKVGGSYNDDLIHHTVVSPKTCPTSPPSPTTVKTTTSREATTTTRAKITTTEPSSSSPKTTSTIKTWSEVKTNHAETEVPPPASLPDRISNAAGVSVSQLPSGMPVTEYRNTEGSFDGRQGDNQKEKKQKVDWLVTGLIIAVAILLVILAASVSVLLRKKCKKRASGRNKDFAMNVSYCANAPLGPSYEEVKPTSCAEDGARCEVVEENLYESIDNLVISGLKGATAATHDYAVASVDKSQVALTDKNSNNNQLDLQPRRTRGNQYDSPRVFQPKNEYNVPVTEVYTDMSQGSASETSPLCVAADNKYENMQDDDVTCTIQQPPDELYEDMAAKPERVPLVAEYYVRPSTSNK